MWYAKWMVVLTLFGATLSDAQIVLRESFASETSDLSAPDRSIAAGPNSLVLVDADVTIRDKTGTIITSKNLYQFFLPVTSVGVADPDVIFDPWSSRFFVSAIHGGEPQTCTLGNCVSLVSLAVSKTSTPTIAGCCRCFRGDRLRHITEEQNILPLKLWITSPL